MATSSDGAILRANTSCLHDLLPALRRLDGLLEQATGAAETVYGPDAAADPYRGLYVDRAEVERLLGRQPGAPALYVPDTPAAQPLPDPPGSDSRLGWLAGKFDLSAFDVDVILVALAPELDLRYERLYAYLQDDVTRRRPSVDLALNLLCATAEEKMARRAHFATSGPLLRHDLLHLIPDPNQIHPPLLAHYLMLDEQIVRLLLCQEGLDPRLAPFAQLVEPTYSLDDCPLDPDTRYGLQALVLRARNLQQPLRLYFHGPRGTGKGLAAAALAGAAGLRLLTADLARIASNSGDPEPILKLLFREARLHQALLHLANLDVLRNEDRSTFYHSLLRALLDDVGICVLDGAQAWMLDLALSTHAATGVFSVPFAMLGFQQRRAYWQSRLVASAVSLNPDELAALADRFRLTAAQIAEAVALACNLARWRAAVSPSETMPDDTVTLQDLFMAARLQSSSQLATLARKIEPRYTWRDIVLPPDSLAQLREVCDQVKHRHTVYGQWGFDRRLSLGKDLTVLFSGSSGTGKTMAAEVIASELQLDLYKIDLSRVVSKYIGETEKNLDRIFSAAESANSILFFDEADTLFGKRSQVRDSHDRYANIEIGYLLQKMEEYEGIAILATNMRGNVDQAFLRRVKFHVEFPFPDESYRRDIWQLQFPHQAPQGDDLDFDFLACQFKLPGGSIRNIVLNASFLAAADGRVIGMEHVVLATKREYQKLGKARTEIEFGPYYHLVRNG